MCLGLLLQFQPVMGKTLKGKENFKQLIHTFAEVCCCTAGHATLVIAIAADAVLAV